MFRRCRFALYQVGVHVPHGEAFRGARFKAWPQQKVPANFSLLPEQRWSMLPIQRDTGKVPRNFVLKILYFQQPCAVEQLWRLCTQDSECVLDSKRHLREVLKQCRDEGFVTFSKETTSSSEASAGAAVAGGSAGGAVGAATTSWTCTLTRERFEEVRAMVNMLPDSAGSAMSAGMRGDAASGTSDSAEVFRGLDDAEKVKHLEQLRAQTEAANQLLSAFQRIEIDYLPYTDLHGKVNTMYWYDSVDQAPKLADKEGKDEKLKE